MIKRKREERRLMSKNAESAAGCWVFFLPFAELAGVGPGEKRKPLVPARKAKLEKEKGRRGRSQTRHVPSER